VETSAGPLYTECVEAVINTHASVRRCALVGVGRPGAQQPVLVVERNTAAADDWRDDVLRFAQQHAATRSIEHVLAHPALPVDIRHNAKINREQLARWATTQLGNLPAPPPAPRPQPPAPSP
jgi:acyl-coenzyme A synthetase/AMP-(fatty) acid ligase